MVIAPGWTDAANVDEPDDRLARRMRIVREFSSNGVPQYEGLGRAPTAQRGALAPRLVYVHA
jgi:hypothetical protein